MQSDTNDFSVNHAMTIVLIISASPSPISPLSLSINSHCFFVNDTWTLFIFVILLNKIIKYVPHMCLIRYIYVINVYKLTDNSFILVNRYTSPTVSVIEGVTSQSRSSFISAFIFQISLIVLSFFLLRLFVSRVAKKISRARIYPIALFWIIFLIVSFIILVYV